MVVSQSLIPRGDAISTWTMPQRRLTAAATPNTKPDQTRRGKDYSPAVRSAHQHQGRFAIRALRRCVSGALASMSTSHVALSRSSIRGRSQLASISLPFLPSYMYMHPSCVCSTPAFETTVPPSCITAAHRSSPPPRSRPSSLCANISDPLRADSPLRTRLPVSLPLLSWGRLFHRRPQQPPGEG